MSKIQRHPRSGAGRGVSQDNGAAIHSKLPGLCPHYIVSGILKNGSNVGLCKPVVGAWYVMCACVSVSQFLPHNSATLQLQVLMSMQMNAAFDKEQILLVWVGTGRGVWGVVCPSGVSTQKYVPSKKINTLLLKVLNSLITPHHLITYAAGKQPHLMQYTL